MVVTRWACCCHYTEGGAAGRDGGAKTPCTRGSGGGIYTITVFSFESLPAKSSSGSGNAVVQALAIALYKPAVGSYFLLQATLSRITVS